MASQASLFQPNNQRQYGSQFVENGSSSKQSWPQAQLLQPAMISQRSLHSHNQEHCSSRFVESGSNSKQPWPQTQHLQPAMISQRSLHPNNQEQHYSSQFMETGASSKQSWPQNQLLQPAMISQRASSSKFPDNIFLQNHSVQHNQQINQQIKLENQPANRVTGPHQNWAKQSNFFRQSMSNVAPLLNMGMNNAGIQNPQQMNFGHLKLNSPLPSDLNATPQKLKMPTFATPQTGFATPQTGFATPQTAKGIHLNPDKNKLRAGPSSGIGSSSMNIECQGLNPWPMPSEEWQELLKFTYQQQQFPMQGLHEFSFGSPLPTQTVNTSDEFPIYFHFDEPKVAESAENENQRKRKEPSYSGSEKSLGNREVAGPSKIPHFNLASSLELETKTLSKNCGEVELHEITKPLDVSGHLKEDSITKDAEHQPPSTEGANDKGPLKDANSEDHGEIDSSTEWQDLLADNRDDKNDENMLGDGILTMTEGPVEKANLIDQQLKQDVSLNDDTHPEKSDIHLSAKEAGDETNGTDPSTIPHQATLDESGEKVKDP